MEGERRVLLWVKASVQATRNWRNWLKVVWVWLESPLLESEKDWAGVEGQKGELEESCSLMVCGRKDGARGRKNGSQEQTRSKRWPQPMNEEKELLILRSWCLGTESPVQNAPERK